MVRWFDGKMIGWWDELGICFMNSFCGPLQAQDVNSIVARPDALLIISKTLSGL